MATAWRFGGIGNQSLAWFARHARARRIAAAFPYVWIAILIGRLTFTRDDCVLATALVGTCSQAGIVDVFPGAAGFRIRTTRALRTTVRRDMRRSILWILIAWIGTRW